jgi:chromosome partitioning protein
VIEKKNVISFLNMKGGVCKTTLCKEMAVFLSAKKNRSILVIDIDPQSNCTQSFFERHNVLEIEEGEVLTEKISLPSIENIFSKSKGGLRELKLEDVILELNDSLHIIPGDLDTVFMERETGTGSSEQKLFNFIDQFSLQEKYDYIFIDCPPTYSFYTVSALLSSNYYLVPLKPDVYSLLGLDLLERVVSELQSSYRANFNSKPIKNLGTIFTMVPKNPSKGTIRNILQIKETFEDKNVYFFRNDFPKAEKISTGKLSTFIIDREDNELLGKLTAICEEFEERMVSINGE